MLKIEQICGKCGKHSLSVDDEGSTLVIDYKESMIGFICPNCNHNNYLNLGDIQKALDKKSKLPSIGSF